MSSRKRGQLYVDRDVQRALLWQLFRHWALFIGMLMGMLLALEMLESGMQRSLAEHCGALWTRYAPLFVVVAALFPVFAYDSIRLSNRFVGPIVRLRRAMVEIVAGEPPRPLKFRQGDFWQDMAENFNLMIETLGDRQDGASERSEQLERREPALTVVGDCYADSEDA